MANETDAEVVERYLGYILKWAVQTFNGRVPGDNARRAAEAMVAEVRSRERQNFIRASDVPSAVRHGLNDLTSSLEQAVRSAYLLGVSHGRARSPTANGGTTGPG